MSYAPDYCERRGCQPTQVPCPAKESLGLSHHLIPRRDKDGAVLACIYCKKTEKEIRES